MVYSIFIFKTHVVFGHFLPNLIAAEKDRNAGAFSFTYSKIPCCNTVVK